MILYHILSRVDWERARTTGEYRALSLVSEGFVHASTREQLVETANRYYPGQGDLLLLAIDEAKCKPEVRFEPVERPGGVQHFPHIYGPLNLDAVIEVIEFPPGPDGKFHLPDPLTRRF